MSRSYYVLSEDTIDELSALSGKSIEDLRLKLEEARKLYSRYVIWREINTWIAYRVSSELEVVEVVREVFGERVGCGR